MEEPIEPSYPNGTEVLSSDIELTDKTILINNTQLAFLQTVDKENAVLEFSSLLPKEYLPEVGQILLRLAPTEKLPYGFIGQVTSVKSERGNYTVITDAPTLNEAFNKLIIRYDPRKIPQVKTRADIIDETEFTVDEEGYFCFNKDLSLNQNGTSITCGVSLGLNPSVELCLDTKNNINQHEYGFGIKANSSIRYGLTLEGMVEKESDLGNGYVFNMPGATPAIQGAIQFSWVTKAQGSMQVAASLQTSVKNVYRISKNNENAHAVQNPSSTSQIGIAIEPEFKCMGELFAGLGVGIELRLFGRKELAVGIKNEIGPFVAAEVDLLHNHSALYEQYQDTMVELQGTMQCGAYAQAKLFGWKLEWEKELGEPWVFWNSPRYIFPSFEGQFEVNEKSQADCSVKLGRNLLFKSNTGISQYDASEKLRNSSTSLPYFEAENFPNPLTASFVHEKDFTYWSYMRWGDLYVKCKELNPWNIVGDWEVLSYEFYETNGHDYERHIYEYKNGTHYFSRDVNSKIEENSAKGNALISQFRDDGSCYINWVWYGIDDVYAESYQYAIDYEQMNITLKNSKRTKICTITNSDVDQFVMEWSYSGTSESVYEKITLRRITDSN